MVFNLNCVRISFESLHMIVFIAAAGAPHPCQLSLYACMDDSEGGQDSCGFKNKKMCPRTVGVCQGEGVH